MNSCRILENDWEYKEATMPVQVGEAVPSTNVARSFRKLWKRGVPVENTNPRPLIQLIKERYRRNNNNHETSILCFSWNATASDNFEEHGTRLHGASSITTA